MSNNNNNNWKLGIGLLAGAAIGWWLNSDQGRYYRMETQRAAMDYSRQTNAFLKEKASDIGEQVNEYYEQGVNAVNNATETVKQTLTSQVDQVADTAEEAVDGTETKVKKGIKRARSNMKNAVNSAG